ncbi:MAG: hypothetical protein LBQ58_10555, partial [Synergistaceae bacterium]|nr:hypothetical protein [Synergistaceae bacterium]
SASAFAVDTGRSSFLGFTARSPCHSKTSPLNVSRTCNRCLRLQTYTPAVVKNVMVVFIGDSCGVASVCQSIPA